MLLDESPAATDSGRDAAMQAATDLVAAFGAHDTRRYFAGFAPDATFLFHNVPGLVQSRAAYEGLWQDWEKDGFHVLACRSLNPRLDLIADNVAVFTHDVATQLAGESEEQHEQETIVLRRGPDGHWLGVHEHLSADSRPQQTQQ